MLLLTRLVLTDRPTDSARDCSDKDSLTDREMLCCGTARRRWNQFLKQERDRETCLHPSPGSLNVCGDALH